MIVLSDHGMSDISCDRVVIANDHLSPGTLEQVYMYPGTNSRIGNDYKYDASSGGNVEIPEAEQGLFVHSIVYTIM